MNNYYWAGGGDETNNFLESATLFLKWHWSHGHSKYYDQNRIFEASSYLKVFWSLIFGFFSSPIPGSKVSSFLGSTLSLHKNQNQIYYSHFYSFLLIFGLENVDDDFLLVLLGLVVSPRLQLGEDAAKLLPGARSFGQGAESVLSIFNPTDNL